MALLADDLLIILLQPTQLMELLKEYGLLSGYKISMNVRPSNGI